MLEEFVEVQTRSRALGDHLTPFEGYMVVGPLPPRTGPQKAAHAQEMRSLRRTRHVPRYRTVTRWVRRTPRAKAEMVQTVEKY